MEQELFELFLELHAGLPRQAPGSRESTLRALSGLPLAGVRGRLRHVADMGCGPGAHSLELASMLDARVLCLELLPMFLQELKDRAAALELQDRVRPLLADMGRPPLAAESLDLVWSEGSIYNIGFAQGLQCWAGLLRPGGFAAVSELCWLTPSPPEAARRFWAQHYPAMRGVEETLHDVAAAGLEPLGHFTLPEEDWWQDYYMPLEARMGLFALQHGENERAMEVLAMEREEIELRRHYGRSYGYVFFLAGRPV